MWNFTDVSGEVGRLIMLIPRVIIGTSAYNELLNRVCDTSFQYEIGGVLIGYKYLRIFYIVALTFPRCYRNMGKVSFVLNGEEHTEDIEKIREGFLFPTKIIGVWHSHTLEDNSLSLQDRESNRLLVTRFGDMLSVVVTSQKGKKDIRLTSYYISKDNKTYICKAAIRI